MSNEGDTICVWYNTAHTAYTVQNWQDNASTGNPDVMFSPKNKHNDGKSYYCVWELAAPWARDTGTRVALLAVRPKFGDSQDKCRHIQDVLCLVSNILSQHSIRPVENLVKAKLMPYLPFGADRSIRSRSAEALHVDAWDPISISA